MLFRKLVQDSCRACIQTPSSIHHQGLMFAVGGTAGVFSSNLHSTKEDLLLRQNMGLSGIVLK